MEELVEILTDLHPEIDVLNCTTLIDDGILDSFDIITLISEISDRMDVVIPAEEIVPEHFNSIEMLWEFIQSLED